MDKEKKNNSKDSNKERRFKIICLGLITAMTLAQVSILVPTIVDLFSTDKKVAKQAEFTIMYLPSEYFNDTAVEGMDWSVERISDGVVIAFGTTLADGMIVFDIMPNVQYKLMTTNYPIDYATDFIFDHTNAVQTRYIHEKYITLTAEFDIDTGVLAEGVSVDMWYFDGGSWSMVGTNITDALGQIVWHNLLAGTYMFEVDGVQYAEIVMLKSDTSIVQNILLPALTYSNSLLLILNVLLLGKWATEQS